MVLIDTNKLNRRFRLKIMVSASILCFWFFKWKSYFRGRRRRHIRCFFSSLTFAMFKIYWWYENGWKCMYSFPIIYRSFFSRHPLIASNRNASQTGKKHFFSVWTWKTTAHRRRLSVSSCGRIHDQRPKTVLWMSFWWFNRANKIGPTKNPLPFQAIRKHRQNEYFGVFSSLSLPL